MNSIIIDGRAVDTEVFSFRFECDYAQCKGYCCWGQPEDGEVIGGCTINDAEYKLIEQNKMIFARYVDEDLLTFLKKPLTIIEDGRRMLRADGNRCALCSKKLGSCVVSLARKDGKIPFGMPTWGAIAPLRVDDAGILTIDNGMFESYSCCRKSLEVSKKCGRYIWQFLRSQLVDCFGESFYNQLVEEAKKWI